MTHDNHMNTCAEQLATLLTLLDDGKSSPTLNERVIHIQQLLDLLMVIGKHPVDIRGGVVTNALLFSLGISPELQNHYAKVDGLAFNVATSIRWQVWRMVVQLRRLRTLPTDVIYEDIYTQLESSATLLSDTCVGQWLETHDRDVKPMLRRTYQELYQQSQTSVTSAKRHEWLSAGAKLFGPINPKIADALMATLNNLKTLRNTDFTYINAAITIRLTAFRLALTDALYRLCALLYIRVILMRAYFINQIKLQGTTICP